VKTAIFKTFNTKKHYIDEYLTAWRNQLFPDILTTHLKWNIPIIELNTFIINQTVLKEISQVELEKLTSKLLNIFPVSKSGKRYFDKVIGCSQFKSNTDNFSISDYSIVQFEQYIIIWHLDLYHKMGITINSIFKTSNIKLLKPLNKKIIVKVS